MGIPNNPLTILSNASKNIIRIMNNFDVKRYTLITGLSVDTPIDTKSLKVKFGTDWRYKNYLKPTADRQVEFEILSKNNLN